MQRLIISRCNLFHYQSEKQERERERDRERKKKILWAKKTFGQLMIKEENSLKSSIFNLHRNLCVCELQAFVTRIPFLFTECKRNIDWMMFSRAKIFERKLTSNRCSWKSEASEMYQFKEEIVRKCEITIYE